MPEPKRSINSKDEPMHFSAGAVIERDGKYLLLDRINPPPGWAGPAGHVDEGEDPESAVRREVFEETGLTVTSVKLLFAKEVHANRCVMGIDCHYWVVYQCEVTGEIHLEHEEARAIGWYGPEALRHLPLEEVWKLWFTKLGVLQP